MRSVSFRGVTFELSDASDSPAFFVLSVRKCGSSVLNQMAWALASGQGLPFIDVTGRLFDAGFLPNSWRTDPEVGRLIDGGNVYSGFRDFPTAIAGSAVFLRARKILLIRDPRDALISEYFSSAYSHPLPPAGAARERMLEMRAQARVESMESMVLKRADGMGRTMMEFAPLLADLNLKLFHYEQVITRKREFMEDICRHFGWRLWPRLIDSVLPRVDIFPERERPSEFVRRVLPGEHREKLSGETIAELNRLLEAPLRAFGYAS
jgi:hypothetical protein